VHPGSEGSAAVGAAPVAGEGIVAERSGGSEVHARDEGSADPPGIAQAAAIDADQVGVAMPTDRLVAHDRLPGGRIDQVATCAAAPPIEACSIAVAGGLEEDDEAPKSDPTHGRRAEAEVEPHGLVVVDDLQVRDVRLTVVWGVAPRVPLDVVASIGVVVGAGEGGDLDGNRERENARDECASAQERHHEAEH